MNHAYVEMKRVRIEGKPVTTGFLRCCKIFRQTENNINPVCGNVRMGRIGPLMMKLCE